MDSVLRRRVRAVPAVANGEFIGIITLTDVKAVPADRGIVSGA
jgi:hypothetical protein